MSTGSTGLSSATKYALEQQHRIEREELVSDTLRLRWLSVAGTLVWLAFSLDDWVISKYLAKVSLHDFLVIRWCAVIPVLYVVALLLAKRRMTRTKLMVLDIGIFCGMQGALSLMCIHFNGIASPLVTGIVVVLVARTSVLASPWRRGLLTLGIPLLCYPAILGVSSYFSDTIYAQFHDPHAIAAFLRNLFAIGAALGLCVWGAHGNWKMRRQLFEARNIGRYRLKHRIGRGGMGEVWVAYHSGLKQDVALKILRPDSEGDPIAVQRFEQEVAATSRLTHPNTVRVFDYGVTDDGIWYYAMELLEGSTIQDLIRETGPLEIGRALRISHQVARALSEAHSRGIVHRDIKPENIFLTRAGDEPDIVKVLDFGIAKLCGEARGATLTQVGAVFGTPAYMSPEAAQGRPTSTRSDVYGLGAVMYFMLAGTPPFGSRVAADLVLAHITQPVPAFDSHPNVDVPKDVSDLVMRCLAKDPDARFADAGELANALAKLTGQYA